MRYLIITMFLLASVTAGCAPQTRYKVLSFFIDGVPNPEKTLPGGGKVTEVSKEDEPKFKVFIHGPYGARICTACHEGGYSNRLRYPKEELCLHCHSFNMKTKWVHGPLAGGGCLICHDPHISRYKYLLVAKPEEFCFYCHNRSSVLSHAWHGDALQKGCTTCHDAHMSDRRFMLKKGVKLIEASDKEKQSRS